MVSAGCAILFRRGIAGRHGARPARSRFAALDQLGQSKIHQDDLPTRRYFHISRFNIAVDDLRLARMQITQRVTYRGSQDDGIRVGKSTFTFHALAQVFPLDVIHHQVLPLRFDDKMIGDAWQVRVAQVSQDHRFPPELAGIFLGGKQVLLDGHIYPQVLVHGAINRAHPTLA